MAHLLQTQLHTFGADLSSHLGVREHVAGAVDAQVALRQAFQKGLDLLSCDRGE